MAYLRSSSGKLNNDRCVVLSRGFKASIDSRRGNAVDSWDSITWKRYTEIHSVS
jgi:hypothetical protein